MCSVNLSGSFFFVFPSVTFFFFLFSHFFCCFLFSFSHFSSFSVFLFSEKKSFIAYLWFPFPFFDIFFSKKNLGGSSPLPVLCWDGGGPLEPPAEFSTSALFTLSRRPLKTDQTTRGLQPPRQSSSHFNCDRPGEDGHEYYITIALICWGRPKCFNIRTVNYWDCVRRRLGSCLGSV